MSSQRILAVCLCFALAAQAFAHSGHDGDHGTDHQESTSIQTWTSPAGVELASGRLIAVRGESVCIRNLSGQLVQLRLNDLSPAHRELAMNLKYLPDTVSASINNNPSEPRPSDEVKRLAKEWIPVFVSTPAFPASTIAEAFSVFEQRKDITTRSDDRWFYVESRGIPKHQMMVGITSWQQQVPLPQNYTASNAWQIPLKPVPARNPRSANGNFLRGAIAVAVNGIPIFNPLNNRGDDAYLVGELDEFGGHCGRADDYHYHIAPVHLQEVNGRDKPIAYALDGYPIYGYDEPDGSPAKNLDALNGHHDADGNYHYHATKKYPYLNGGFHGEVTEREGQVDPQPRAEPVRPDLRPLQGARITAFRETAPGTSLLTYEIRGRKGTVEYTQNANGSLTFVFTDPEGKSTTETYQPRRRAEGGGRPPRPRQEENPPQRKGRKGEQGPPDEPKSGDRKQSGQKQSRDASSQAGSPDTPKGQKTKNAATIQITSRSVDSSGQLSIDCTCDGKSESPAVAWQNLPNGTKSIAISLWHTAPDQEKSYWVVYNIPANVKELSQNGKPTGVVGLNDRKKAEYDPMCSRGPGVKTYHLTVYALSEELPSGRPLNRADLLKAISGKVLGESTLDFDYERK